MERYIFECKYCKTVFEEPMSKQINDLSAAVQQIVRLHQCTEDREIEGIAHLIGIRHNVPDTEDGTE